MLHITKTNSSRSFHNNLQNKKTNQKQKIKKIFFLAPLKHHASSSLATELN